MVYCHLTLASVGRVPLFPRREDRLEVVRALVRYDAAVVLSCAVDDHLHVVVEGPRPSRLAGDLRRLLSRRQEVRPAYLKTVTERRHLLSLVEYVLRQPAKHDLAGHPALWEGSCFVDLVGARSIGFDPAPFERALPRGHHREILSPVGLRHPVVPLPWEDLAGCGLEQLARAATAAAGLDSLRGPRTPERVRARRVLAHLAHRVGLPASAVAGRLDQVPRSVRRLRAGPADPALLAATRTWLALERACGL